MAAPTAVHGVVGMTGRLGGTRVAGAVGDAAIGIADGGGSIEKEYLISQLRGKTKQADRILDALEANRINVTVANEEQFNAFLKKYNVDPTGKLGYTAFRDSIVKGTQSDPAAGIVHEGTHALMNLSGKRYEWMGAKWGSRTREFVAYYHERQFQIAAGHNPYHPTLWGMIKHIYKHYP